MTENQTRVWAKTGKGADVRAEAEREATGIIKAKARLEIDTVEVKAGSKGKVAAKMEERSVDKGLTNTMPATPWAVSGGENDTDFVPKAGGEATKLPGISCAGEATAASGATHKDGTGIDAWFWVGEEAGIGPWFWNGEKAGHQFSAKNVDETDTGPSINAEELGIESVTGASCKPRPELEELVEEELKGQKEQKEEKEKEKEKKKKKNTEVFIGNWFWDGDDTSFDPNPKPVYRIIKPQVACKTDEKNKLKEWCEGTAWHNTSAEISAFLAFASQVLQRMRHVSYNSPSSGKKNTGSGKKNTGSLSLDDSSLSEGTSICLESIDAYPFESKTCTQTIVNTREQIRIRELSGIKRFGCPCKMECCLGSEGFENLVSLLKSDTDPLIHKIAQIAMGIINVHPLAPQCINEMGVLNVY